MVLPIIHSLCMKNSFYLLLCLLLALVNEELFAHGAGGIGQPTPPPPKPKVDMTKPAVEVYGYVKLDMQYNSKDMGSMPSPVANFTPLNSDAAAQHSEFIVDARESRVGVRAEETFRDITVLGLIEADFYTSEGSAISNGRLLRLRHAYARANLPSSLYFLAGQTWSLFMNSDIAVPDVLDFNGPVGEVSVRQPELRGGYFYSLGETGDLLFEASIEKQAVGRGVGHTNSTTFSSTDQGSMQKVPLLVGKVSYLRENFKWEAALCASQDWATLNSSGNQSHQTAWGAQSSAQYKYKRLTLLGSINHVTGLGRVYQAGLYPDAIIDIHNKLRAIKVNGFYVGLRWDFTRNTSINTIYGWNMAYRVPHSLFSGSAISFYQDIYFNIMHRFYKNWKVGLEYQRNDIKAFNGQHGDVNILHFGLYYFF